MFTKLDTIENIELRVLSIDPGTNKLGCSFALAHLGCKTFTVLDANTIDIDRLVNIVHNDKVISHGKYNTMTDCVYQFINKLIQEYQPDWVICESPYMNSRFPLPYALLTLCVQSIQQAVKDFDVTIGFSLIDPASVKKRIGVKGNSGDKQAVYHALLKQPYLRTNIDLTNNSIDEHASDAIAIGYYGFMEYLICYRLI